MAKQAIAKNGEIHLICITCSYEDATHTALAEFLTMEKDRDYWSYNTKCLRCGTIDEFSTKLKYIMDFSTDNIDETTNTYKDLNGYTRCINCHRCCEYCECHLHKYLMKRLEDVKTHNR